MNAIHELYKCPPTINLLIKSKERFDIGNTKAENNSAFELVESKVPLNATKLYDHKTDFSAKFTQVAFCNNRKYYIEKCICLHSGKVHFLFGNFSINNKLT